MDDMMIRSSCWEEHLNKFATADLTEIGHAQVTFLGYVVGSRMVKPLSAKVQAIIDYSPQEGTYASLWQGGI